MEVTYNRLKSYLPEVGDLTPDELSEILTGIGLEVASVEKVEQIKGGLKGLVIG